MKSRKEIGNITDGLVVFEGLLIETLADIRDILENIEHQLMSLNITEINKLKK